MDTAKLPHTELFNSISEAGGISRQGIDAMGELVRMHDSKGIKDFVKADPDKALAFFNGMAGMTARESRIAGEALALGGLAELAYAGKGQGAMEMLGRMKMDGHKIKALSGDAAVHALVTAGKKNMAEMADHTMAVKIMDMITPMDRGLQGYLFSAHFVTDELSAQGQAPRIMEIFRKLDNHNLGNALNAQAAMSALEKHGFGAEAARMDTRVKSATRARLENQPTQPV